ncbi:MAG: amidohydrolase family protein [Melioribacteraceae bacterium]|nr:amidohydrolase family protein [Melioribacteraceae bacterium]
MKMATINAAEFLNLKDYGQVKENFIASLVLLDENPLTDIRNTRRINSVILKGKISDK